MGQRHGGVDIPACSRSIHWGIWLCSGQVHSQMLCSPHCRQRSEACCACPGVKGQERSRQNRFLRIAAARLSASLHRGVVAIWLTFAPALDNAISRRLRMPRPRIHPRVRRRRCLAIAEESLPSPAAAPAPGSFARRKVRLHGCTSHLCAVAFTFPAAAGNSTISMTPNGRGHHAGFTADALLLVNLHAVVYLTNGIIPSCGRRGAFTMATCYCVTFCSCFITVMRGKKRCKSGRAARRCVPSRRPLRRLYSRYICDYR